MEQRKAIALFILSFIAKTAAAQERFEAGEEFIRKMEITAKLPDRHIGVIFDPNAKSCGWANTVAGRNLIGLEPKCWKSHDADYQVSVLAHEIGHIHRGHTFNKGGATKTQQLEADEMGGYVVGMMGGSLRQALAHAKTTYIGEGGPDPSQAARVEATTRGWQLSQQALHDQDPFWQPEAVKQPGVAPGKTILGVDTHSFLIGMVVAFALVLFFGRGR